MRAAATLVVLLLAPAAFALPETDTRELIANWVNPTGCPGFSTPAPVACFEAPANATSARLVAKPDVGNAQPRMFVRVYDGSALLASFWMCDDGSFGVSGATDVYVDLDGDRSFCGDARPGIVAHGKLSLTWS